MIKSILAGVIGTAVMTGVMMIAPMMGMPKMSPPHMLSGMMGMPIAAGWAMHFGIGIMFAIAYTMLFSKVNISNIWVKGAAFGVVAFIAAQIGMQVMGMMMPMPPMEGPMMLTAIGSLMGHVIFGMTVAKVAGDTSLV